MSLANRVLAVNDNLPIKTALPIHSGKVRSVYWLSAADSARLIQQQGYNLAADTPLAIMIISDRISAFDCIWHGENDLQGIPGKGAALNTIAAHWFATFKSQGLANSHIVDIPHPLIWIVQKAKPILIEAICRQYITGSLWRSYARGERTFCGLDLPEGLTDHGRLPKAIITPSTKGILRGIAGVPEADDVNITRKQLLDNYAAFQFESPDHIALYEQHLLAGFRTIESALGNIGQIFVDTKFEFGYIKNAAGDSELIYMDEVGTPDSSRIWDGQAYQQGSIIERSKEAFRQFLLTHTADPDILLNKDRMAERQALANTTALPLEVMMAVSKTYCDLASAITGSAVIIPENPREVIIDCLNRYGLIQ
jgi:phosphoribosylaminoimidazole-succinocarboxamide synthase